MFPGYKSSVVLLQHKKPTEKEKKTPQRFPTSPFQLVLIPTQSLSLLCPATTLPSLSESSLLASWRIPVQRHPGTHWCKPIKQEALPLCGAQCTFGTARALEHLWLQVCFPQKTFTPAWPSRGMDGSPRSPKLLSHQRAVFSTHQFLSHTHTHPLEVSFFVFGNRQVIPITSLPNQISLTMHIYQTIQEYIKYISTQQLDKIYTINVKLF